MFHCNKVPIKSLLDELQPNNLINLQSNVTPARYPIGPARQFTKIKKQDSKLIHHSRYQSLQVVPDDIDKQQLGSHSAQFKSQEQLRIPIEANESNDAAISSIKQFTGHMKKYERHLVERVQIIKKYFMQDSCLNGDSSKKQSLLNLLQMNRNNLNKGGYFKNHCLYKGIKFVEVLSLLEDDQQAQQKLVKQKIRKGFNEISLSQGPLTEQLGSFNFWFPDLNRKQMKMKLNQAQNKPEYNDDERILKFSQETMDIHMIQSDIIESLVEDSKCGHERSSFNINRKCLPAREMVSLLKEYSPKMDLIRIFNDSQYLNKQEEINEQGTYDRANKRISNQNSLRSTMESFSPKINQLLKYIVSSNNKKLDEQPSFGIQDTQIQKNREQVERMYNKEMNRIKKTPESMKVASPLSFQPCKYRNLTGGNRSKIRAMTLIPESKTLTMIPEYKIPSLILESKNKEMRSSKQRNQNFNTMITDLFKQKKVI